MRDAFSNALVRLALADPKVLLLTGDHGYALFDEFRKRCPDQYINAGIAEQNMVGMAAGLARVGFRPFVYGLAAFVPIRTVEQIKLDIAHDDLPVVLLGDGAGFVYSHLGTSHQSTEDIACTRAIPGLEVLSPADRFEMTASMDYAYAASGPVYLRMGKSDRGDVHAEPVQALRAGGLLQVRAGRSDRPGLIATGSMVHTAVDVAQALELSVWSAPVLKPLRAEDVCAAARATSGLVTLEEHSVLGGLGAAVAEISSEYEPVRVLRIGVPDRFSEYCGTHTYLLREHGLDTDSVRAKVESFSQTTRPTASV
ncbi:transketolase [Comamonas aquatica]|uniref:Transketolase n=1 Tax=Comamonas aquatica TaxID=225991 RepID=A0AA43AY58_9BURK|nr:transketolase C-terminal domain-containing protein [Comamonas aquatica]MDH1429846.1 transketolase [Comamonas aquatica]MDH1607474.1 transketolase [Comamonas aquatica]MDH1619212.1 transketolase [Comamonas aquatica]MDH2007195.1 transketolase [Comamonas aquatica]